MLKGYSHERTADGHGLRRAPPMVQGYQVPQVGDATYACGAWECASGNTPAPSLRRAAHAVRSSARGGTL